MSGSRETTGGKTRHSSCLHGTYGLIRRKTVSKTNTFLKIFNVRSNVKKRQRIPVREIREGDSG